MTLQQIKAADIAGWDSLQDIADSLEKRGLKTRPNLGEEHQLVLQLSDNEFVVIVEAGPGESATDFKPENRTRHTNLVATNDFEEFTFLTRVRSWEGQQHGRIKHQKLSFSKEQFERDSGEKNTILQKLNSIEYGTSAAIYDTLYDTRQVVKKFYQQFENLRTDLVQEVSGIPDDRGDAKQRYVQVILDRMIFLYFIQEKRLLHRDRDYLHEQPAKVVDEGEDRYEEFYAPLFFDYLAEDKQNPDFGKLPYLNGGLFAKNPVEEEFEDAKLGDSAEKTNELFDDILDFLSDWNWNVDERLDIVDPKNLSPAVLGHIFEQTVNQKEMGAYYTPEEITGFMARRTVHPYLLDQLNETVGASYNEIDDVFGFTEIDASKEAAALADGGMVTQQAPTENVDVGHVETLYHDILKETKVLDPAVGSGAFLLAGQEVLLDLYMQCIEFFQRLEDEGKGWELSSRTRDELETIASGKGNASLYAKRTIILNNLYGVDIDDGAVEICKLRLWLSMVADIEDEPGEVEPLPNIDFNIRQGNSLIGFTELTEVATESGDASLTNYGGGVGESVREMYEDVIKAVKRHKQANTASEATTARNLAESRIQTYSESLDEKILEEFRDSGVDDVSLEDISNYEPFHWVLEFATVYQDGGFDLIIGNPPWDVLTKDRSHFFPKYDEIFRTRSPSGKNSIQEDLLKDPEIEKEWERYQKDMERRSAYFNNCDRFKLQSPKVAGQTVANENDLSMLFLERVYKLISDGGYVSLILPGVVFNGGAAKDLRNYALQNTTLNYVLGFENRGIFPEIDNRYRFGIMVFKNTGGTGSVYGIFNQTTVDVLRNIEEISFEIPKRVLENYSPEAGIFPYVDSEREVDVLNQILKHPPASAEIDSAWHAELYRELDSSLDSDRFFENETVGDYPIYQGKNIFQYSHDSKFVDDLEEVSLWGIECDKDRSAKWRIREKAFRSRDPSVGLKKAIYTKFNGTGSQKGFVNNLLEEHDREPLSLEDVLLDCTEYRVAFRKIARSTDERTVIATVLPKGAVAVDSIHTVRPYSVDPEEEHLGDYPLHSAYERVFTDKELFTFVGLLNSIPFDYLLRTKIDSNILKYKFEESQIPRLTQGDDWFEFISIRAARLNCYGEEFEEMRQRLGGVDVVDSEEERKTTQAEIDAAAFHAYDLSEDQMDYILSEFHTVDSPRVMTDEYISSVRDKYHQLKE
ncbi:type II restriction endonuclease subunit M [Haloferax sp. MBLA0076]|uniref:site-specific DNA-methyltransferase (adenine-specific) n=1 Tax=Haloferax litoreum TaxID=2666140 RepID=A0A6A8GFR4_9EURY|nr:MULTISPECIES: DNA methyltransferase [Haloferax]KAB1193472.1 type II restriction endonuclease subunit M [Haloferax sp. CBA1148]MRX21985.1 type II restriction endonuclease subunit M [Haloferax litoreum]